MFRALVGHRVRDAWSQLARGDYGYVLDQLAPSFTHSFAGDHALGGERRSREAQRAWFQRLFRLLPALSSSSTTCSCAADRGGRALSRSFTSAPPSRADRTRTSSCRPPTSMGPHHTHPQPRGHTEARPALERLSAAGVDEARAAPISDHEPRVSGSKQQRVAR